MRPDIRTYADTSVFGGVFDEEFRLPSRRFFQQVKTGNFALVTSVIVQNELEEAPDNVAKYFNEMLEFAEMAELSEKALALRRAYLQAKVVTNKYADDALHVALATVAGCDLIVSWNFKHIVHFQKIPLYNAINTIQGYAHIAIYSPSEVIKYEK